MMTSGGLYLPARNNPIVSDREWPTSSTSRWAETNEIFLVHRHCALRPGQKFQLGLAPRPVEYLQDNQAGQVAAVKEVCKFSKESWPRVGRLGTCLALMELIRPENSSPCFPVYSSAICKAKL